MSSHFLGFSYIVKRAAPLLVVIVIFGYGIQSVFAQTSVSALYVPLIGITSVPDPLSLPDGAGPVTYRYAVKNFLPELPLVGITVVDDNCSPVRFTGGDNDKNAKLEYGETWRYSCTTDVATTTESVATVTGVANNIIASHNAYATVVVGSDTPAPLVSIVNITKVAYPLSLPAEGGKITFTYRVNNPGVVPLSKVTVTDDKCGAVSGKVGDTNGNSLLDMSEVWIYTCAATLQQTTTNTARVVAFANGLKATNSVTLTVKVDTPNLPNAGTSPIMGTSLDMRNTIWGFLAGALLSLVGCLAVLRKKKKT